MCKNLSDPQTGYTTLIKKKTGKAQIINTKNKKDDTITDPADIKKVRGHYKLFM